MNDDPTTLISPLMQVGFGLFALILLGVLVWLIKWITGKFCTALEDNTAATTQLNNRNGAEIDALKQLTTEVRGMHDELLKRPCIAEKRDH